MSHGFVRVSAVCPKVVVGDPAANVTEMIRLLGGLQDSSALRQRFTKN